MFILIDTREQHPLTFAPNGICTGSRVETLPIGDYHAEFTDGTQPKVVFERKSLNDLFGTMTSGYPRFKKELGRAQKAQVQLILIIEGTLTKVYDEPAYSEFPGSSCVRKLFTLWAKYDVYPVFCANRHEMVQFILETYYAIGRLHVAQVRRGWGMKR